MRNRIRIANAPCSWGALEFEGMASEPVPYERMLDELRETGYTGTDLGDWGYMPTEPDLLRAALTSRNLSMVGAFVAVNLRDLDCHESGEERAVRVARLIAAVSDSAYSPRPWLILADDNGTDPVRTLNAGRITSDMGMSDDEWQTFAAGVEVIARAVREQTGLKTLFHHHAAGFVETPEEIARFLDLTDPELIGLVFDTGHYLFGTGEAATASATDGLDRFSGRIHLIHLKDCDPAIASQAREQSWDYFDAVRHGVFSELGQGGVDFRQVLDWLRQHDYDGWAVVEQDVLPGLGTPRESARRNREFLRGLGI